MKPWNIRYGLVNIAFEVGEATRQSGTKYHYLSLRALVMTVSFDIIVLIRVQEISNVASFVEHRGRNCFSCIQYF